LGQTEPWKIKSDPKKKGEIVSYSIHSLLVITKELAALNSGFYSNVK
jgi:hypothetical protein